jgi:hypothetical protein
MAASEVGKEIQYLWALLHDVGFTLLSPANVYEDNLACIAMSTNPVLRKSSRHIDMRVHYCHELYSAGIMKLIPIRTHLMVADALTKSLPGPALSKHRDIMMGHLPFLLASVIAALSLSTLAGFILLRQVLPFIAS